MAEAKNGTISYQYAFGVMVVIGWGVTFWWVQDQTLQQRVQIAHISAVEQRIAELTASIAATAPFIAKNRAVLDSMATTIIRQESSLEKTVLLVRDMNELLQTLARAQTKLDYAQAELRTTVERLEQKRNGKRK